MIGNLEREWRNILLILILVIFVVLWMTTGSVAAQSAPDCSAVTYNGDGTMSNPYEVGNVEQLQCIEEQDLNANYVQVSDIDALETAVWNDNEGFKPIGRLGSGSLFNGTFDGAGYEITGLTIDRFDPTVGLFSRVGPPGTVTNVSVRQVEIIGSSTVGLVGTNQGTVQGSSVSGTFEATTGSDAGGLVGYNEGTVRDSSASVDVTASKEGGGLVGYNEGIVRDSSASGEVTGTDIMGGLVGQNRGGIVRGSSASGDVTGGGGMGGLVGFNDGGIVRDSSASGNVEGDELVGGLVGESTEDSVLRSSSASGNVEGEIDVGGLVGKSTEDSVLRSSSASGDVTASGFHVGGLVGFNEGTVRDSSASGNVEGDEDVGGLVGYNNEEGTVEMSSATGNVTGNVSVGGLVGYNLDTVEKSYAMGASLGFEENVGGLVGSNLGTVEESYARGAVSSFGENVGGLVGRNGESGIAGTVRRSYATGNVTAYFSTPDPFPDPNPPLPEPISAEDSSTSTGGLVGNNNEGPVTDSYWDMNTTGLEVSDGGTGLRTAEMTGSAASSNMQGFDFTDVWQTATDNYPILKWQNEGGGGEDGPLASNNPFGDSSGNPVSRSKVINRVVQWNLNDEINGTKYTRSEIINFIVQWNLAN